VDLPEPSWPGVLRRGRGSPPVLRPVRNLGRPVCRGSGFTRLRLSRLPRRLRARVQYNHHRRCRGLHSLARDDAVHLDTRLPNLPVDPVMLDNGVDRKPLELCAMPRRIQRGAGFQMADIPFRYAHYSPALHEEAQAEGDGVKRGRNVKAGRFLVSTRLKNPHFLAKLGPSSQNDSRPSSGPLDGRPLTPLGKRKRGRGQALRLRVFFHEGSRSDALSRPTSPVT